MTARRIPQIWDAPGRHTVVRSASLTGRTSNANDYADLYTPDGISYYGIKGRTAVGREQLAEAAGGGKLGCQRHKSATAEKPVQTHVTVNLVIEPSPEGATGKSYLVYYHYQPPTTNHQLPTS